MKRLRSTEDLNSSSDKNVKESITNRSATHRGFYYKTENNARKGLISSPSSSSRYDRDRSMNEDRDRDSSRHVRKRSENDFESFERRKGFDRFRDSGDSRGYGGGRGDGSSIRRSESFCVSRREFPKGFRSERDRSRREGSVTSWRRFGSGVKDFEEGSRGNRLEDKGNGKSPKRLKDVKSPTWSKDSGSEQSRLKSPPRGFRYEKERSNSKSKSPTWSKDSASEPSRSEQSKSVDMRKAEDLQVVSGGSSEMEEGELQPEPMANAVPQVEAGSCEKSVQLGADNDKGVQDKLRVEDTDVTVEKKSELVSKREDEPDNDEEDNNKNEVVGKFPEVTNILSDRSQHGEGAVDTPANHGGQENWRTKGNCDAEGEIQNEMMDAILPSNAEEELKHHGVMDLKIKAEEVDLLEINKEASKVNEGLEVNMAMTPEAITMDLRDKGKSLSKICSKEDDPWNDRYSRDLATCADDALEGPSSRGFELFSNSPVRKPEKKDQSNVVKQKDDNPALMPLDLSLSLPNVLLPIGTSEAVPVPVSPCRSLQSLSSFRTNSDGFTASMSFSGSQTFFHNPSCSLTQNSVDYEKSVGSKPLFQGIDKFSQGIYQGQPQNDCNQDNTLYQRVMINGNSSIHQAQASYGISDGQAMQGQHLKVAERDSKIPDGFERQVSFHKQLSGQSRRHDDIRSPAQSNGSHDIGSGYSIDKKRREKSGAHLYKTTSQKEQEQFVKGGSEFVESFVARTVSEPVHVMAKKFHEMTEQSIVHLKEGIRDIMLNTDRCGQAIAFQKVLQNRSDITSEVLKRAHRAQLEILVALKTVSVEFLRSESIASSDLAEIFVGSKCRNPNCRSLIEECDCKVCMQKIGFCSNCMCLICGKFDMAANTCSWVGCDVCLHWCHTDCGIRESYIRNGCDTSGSHEVTEMQFHCIACDHPSEMFGFVKEVFQHFAKEWTVETFCRELEYVKRIFSASRDSRGRRLHDIAGQMLLRLANRSNLPQVYSYIMAFLNDADSSKAGAMVVSSSKEQMKQVKESNGVAVPNQEAPWLNPLYSEKAPKTTDRRNDVISSLMYDRSDKRIAADQELQTSTNKEFGFDNLESIIKVKLAEAKMFQTRAEEARRDAEGLKRIAIAKNEKIEEEYKARITKLRLVEAEEMHKRKSEELESVEKGHMEYFNLKARIEADMKDLLAKMEATKRNLALRSANH